MKRDLIIVVIALSLGILFVFRGCSKPDEQALLKPTPTPAVDIINGKPVTEAKKANFATEEPSPTPTPVPITITYKKGEPFIDIN